MTRGNQLFVGIVVVATLAACSGDYSGSGDVFEDPDAFESEASQQQQELQRRNASARSRRSRARENPVPSTSSEATGAVATGETRTRVTSDGESFDVIIPEPAPVREMEPGGTCGVIEDGVVLVCQPGTFCLSPAEGVPGTCRVAPRAPRTNG